MMNYHYVLEGGWDGCSGNIYVEMNKYFDYRYYNKHDRTWTPWRLNQGEVLIKEKHLIKISEQEFENYMMIEELAK